MSIYCMEVPGLPKHSLRSCRSCTVTRSCWAAPSQQSVGIEKKQPNPYLEVTSVRHQCINQDCIKPQFLGAPAPWSHCRAEGCLAASSTQVSPHGRQQR